MSRPATHDHPGGDLVEGDREPVLRQQKVLHDGIGDVVPEHEVASCPADGKDDRGDALGEWV